MSPNKEDEKLTVKQSQVSITAAATEEGGSASGPAFHFVCGWNEIVSLGRDVSSKYSAPSIISDMKPQFPAQQIIK